MDEPRDEVAFRDENLERIRALILFKAQLASPELAEVLAGVENPHLAGVFARIAAEATAERAELEALLREWTHVARHPRPAGRAGDVSFRDVVLEWASLLTSAARRCRLAALSAPTPGLRARLDALADADERRAAELLAAL